MSCSKARILSTVAAVCLLPTATLGGQGNTAAYFTDFEAAVGPEWSNRTTDTTPKGKRSFLGQFGNETVTLSLDDLRPHDTVTVSFDLFIIRSWDGNHPVHGRDVWSLSARGVGTLLHTTFSNWSKARQAYPKPYGTGGSPAQTGATERDTLGYAFRNVKDSVYRLSFTFRHSGHELTLHFSACGLEGPVDLESWGLDNAKVVLATKQAPRAAANEFTVRASEPKPVYLPFRPREPLARVVYDGPLDVVTLDEGVQAFSNRKYKFLNVPFDLRGLTFIRHAGGAHKGYPLTVVKEGLLLVTTEADGVVKNPLRRSGWKPTGMTFYYNDRGGSRLRVWMKKVKKGTEHIPDRPGFIGTIAIAPSLSATASTSEGQPNAGVSPVYGRFEDVQVQATQNRVNPLTTGVTLQKGQCFVLEPYPQDKWTGGGSKSGVYCDYMGYADRGHNWMRLKYQTGGGTPMPVIGGLKCFADSTGVLKLFCTDSKTDDNNGRVRVLIRVATGKLESLIGKRGGWDTEPRILPPTFALVDLGSMSPCDVNDAGVVAGSVVVNAHPNAHLWKNGQLSELGALRGTDSVAHAINNLGQVVGYVYTSLRSTSSKAKNPRSSERRIDRPDTPRPSSSTDPESVPRKHAFFWDGDHGLIDIGTFGYRDSVAYDINDHGRVVVEADSTDYKRVLMNYRCFLWHKDHPATPIVTKSRFRGINNRGQVAGWHWPGDGGYTGVLWDDGQMLQKGRVVGWRNSAALAVNNLGQCVGWVSKEGHDWDPRDREARLAMLFGRSTLGSLGGGKSHATDINDAGMVVGFSNTRDGAKHAFLWFGGKMHDLADLLDDKKDWVLTHATSISNTGHIVGQGLHRGELRGFMLVPDSPKAPEQVHCAAANEFTVRAADHHQKGPLATGLRVKRGQKIVFLPNESDRWHCGFDPWCNYLGLSPGLDPMRLHFRLGDVDYPVTRGVEYVAYDDGEIQLYCWDKRPGNNRGAVRVRVVVPLILDVDGPVAGRFAVAARAHHQKSPLATGLWIKRGQRILFVPNEQDRWHPGRGDWCDYRGQRPSENIPHMRMHFRVGKTYFRIKSGVEYLAPEDGQIMLYCWDQKPDNNRGSIRVEIISEQLQQSAL